MRIPSLIGAVLATAAATTVFIVACRSGPNSASAQSCAAWEAQIVRHDARLQGYERNAHVPPARRPRAGGPEGSGGKGRELKRITRLTV